ncbi:unnamed protein product [Linum tenue]|uniref:Uncharacterized protein n=1 Tax=Linum tenue TaxID=586396 RepID=A0AAV0M077_9ROSI|nr:unnamed protein product [Linum tenue]
MSLRLNAAAHRLCRGAAGFALPDLLLFRRTRSGGSGGTKTRTRARQASRRARSAATFAGTTKSRRFCRKSGSATSPASRSRRSASSKVAKSYGSAGNRVVPDLRESGGGGRSGTVGGLTSSGAGFGTAGATRSGSRRSSRSGSANPADPLRKRCAAAFNRSDIALEPMTVDTSFPMNLALPSPVSEKILKVKEGDKSRYTATRICLQNFSNWILAESSVGGELARSRIHYLANVLIQRQVITIGSLEDAIALAILRREYGYRGQVSLCCCESGKTDEVRNALPNILGVQVKWTGKKRKLSAPLQD